MPPLSIPTNFADGLDCMCFFLTVSCFRLTVFHVCAYRQMSTSHSIQKATKAPTRAAPAPGASRCQKAGEGIITTASCVITTRPATCGSPREKNRLHNRRHLRHHQKALPCLLPSERPLSAALSARQARLQQDAAASRSGPGSIPAPSGMRAATHAEAQHFTRWRSCGRAGLAAAARRQAVEATGDAARAFQTYADHDLQKLEKEIDAKKAKGQVVSAAEYKLLAELVVRRLCSLRLPPPPPSPRA